MAAASSCVMGLHSIRLLANSSGGGKTETAPAGGGLRPLYRSDISWGDGASGRLHQVAPEAVGPATPRPSRTRTPPRDPANRRLDDVVDQVGHQPSDLRTGANRQRRRARTPSRWR